MATKISQRGISTNLSGTYHKRGSNLKHSEKGFTLVIGTRKNPTPTKPEHYLLLKHNPQRFEYVSSLFPVENSDSTYSLDCKGKLYEMTISGSEVSIKSQGAKR